MHAEFGAPAPRSITATAAPRPKPPNFPRSAFDLAAYGVGAKKDFVGTGVWSFVKMRRDGAKPNAAAPPPRPAAKPVERKTQVSPAPKPPPPPRKP
ncbi:hypothetical protein Rsub_03469 [Raphidocelis subcapitata]|uniref:Uncharacterized protein n=1 Tax=Raphidocelis subcapitata TaxID=307507 RepID=A0A2V0NY31_9CHLO|nr:hypothetical protein Rsub_03469 [Raphidocelis subcapitata]|eukprot:GBF90473.1 hypothetical protein Rsub_03469 [Raphidocelis subcapitata]